MKSITFKQYMNHMRKSYPDYEDVNDFYHILLDVYKSLHKADKTYFDNIFFLLGMSPKERLEYRTKMAEEGRELTPTQVDHLVETIQYALERADV